MVINALNACNARTRVATRPGFPGMFPICAILCVASRYDQPHDAKCPGFGSGLKPDPARPEKTWPTRPKSGPARPEPFTCHYWHGYD